MTSRRKLTATEQESLAHRLEMLCASIEDTYEFPLKDLIANLRDTEQDNRNEVEEEHGVALNYYLHFVSPPETWQMLCGRAGTYTVDATSHQATDFQMMMMN